MGSAVDVLSKKSRHKTRLKHGQPLSWPGGDLKERQKVMVGLGTLGPNNISYRECTMTTDDRGRGTDKLLTDAEEGSLCGSVHRKLNRQNRTIRIEIRIGVACEQVLTGREHKKFRAVHLQRIWSFMKRLLSASDLCSSLI